MTKRANSVYVLVTFAKHVMLITIRLYISAEVRLQNFSIIVGQKNGMYKKCGSSYNQISAGGTTAFSCEAHARGTSLQIKINGKREYLTLCEVFIFGTGMFKENRRIALNNRHCRIYLRMI